MTEKWGEIQGKLDLAESSIYRGSTVVANYG